MLLLFVLQCAGWSPPVLLLTYCPGSDKKSSLRNSSLPSTIALNPPKSHYGVFPNTERVHPGKIYSGIRKMASRQICRPSGLAELD